MPPKKKDTVEEDEFPTTRVCATDEVNERLLRTTPGYASARSAIEDRTQREVAFGGGAEWRSGCTEIPVVVHVLHRTAAENLSDAQVQSQITILNQDFRASNGDRSDTPGVFQPLIGDARITFRLATTDPDGNPTNGITRTSTSNTSFTSSSDNAKSTAGGGHDPWPSDRYLNVWTCGNLRSGDGRSLLGYAQFPGGPAVTDGVVILHSAFGNTGTATAPFDRGRTTTHEVGHWLNLRHIWGDDGTGCSGSDFVADTPNQGGPNYGTPVFPTISCSNGPDGDLFMNYMDYVDDAAMVMFTQGQVARMQACLDGPRSSIGMSVPCSKSIIKDGGKDHIKDGHKDPIKDIPKDGVKDFYKDRPKEFVKERPKDFVKDRPKEFVKDLVDDIDIKHIRDIGPKSLVGDIPIPDPGPWVNPVVNPGLNPVDVPVAPVGAQPFVLGVGGRTQPAGGCGCCGAGAGQVGMYAGASQYVGGVGAAQPGTQDPMLVAVLQQLVEINAALARLLQQ